MRKLALLVLCASALLRGQTGTRIHQVEIIPDPTHTTLGYIDLWDAAQTNYIRLTAPATLSGNGTIQLYAPGTAGCVNDNGSGVQSVIACSGSVGIGPLVANFVSLSGAISGTTVNCRVIPRSGTILSVYTGVGSGPSGSATIDIRTTTLASFQSNGVAGFSGYTSIVASSPPNLSSANAYFDSTLTGWSTSLTAGNILCVQISSPSTVTNVQNVLN